MEAVLNKKNPNRIFRKRANSINQQNLNFSFYGNEQVSSSIKMSATARNNINLLLKAQNTQKHEESQFNDHIQRRKLMTPIKIKQLSRPKNQINSCRQHCSASKTKQNFNKTIVLTSRFDKNNQKFRINKLTQIKSKTQKRHNSLKNHSLYVDEDQTLTKNVINSNKLGILSANQILQIKKKSQQRKRLIQTLFRMGHKISLDAQNVQIQQNKMQSFLQSNYEQYSIIKPSIISVSPQQAELNFIPDINDKKVIGKLKKFYGNLQYSQQKYGIQSYENYHQSLMQRIIPSYRKNKKQKIPVDSAQQWR